MWSEAGGRGRSERGGRGRRSQRCVGKRGGGQRGGGGERGVTPRGQPGAAARTRLVVEEGATAPCLGTPCVARQKEPIAVTLGAECCRRRREIPLGLCLALTRLKALSWALGLVGAGWPMFQGSLSLQTSHPVTRRGQDSAGAQSSRPGTRLQGGKGQCPRGPGTEGHPGGREGHGQCCSPPAPRCCWGSHCSAPGTGGGQSSLASASRAAALAGGAVLVPTSRAASAAFNKQSVVAQAGPSASPAQSCPGLCSKELAWIHPNSGSYRAEPVPVLGAELPP